MLNYLCGILLFISIGVNALETPASLCFKFHAKFRKEFKFPECLEEMKQLLNKVQNTEYHMLVDTCMEADMEFDLCSKTVITFFEKGYEVDQICKIISASEVKTQQDYEVIATHPSSLWKELDEESTVWKVAKKIAQEPKYKTAIDNYKRLIKAQLVMRRSPIPIVCAIGKGTEDLNLEDHILALIYETYDKDWDHVLLEDFLSSDLIKKASQQQLRFMLKHGYNLISTRVSKRTDVWPMEDFHMLKNIPTETTADVIAKFNANVTIYSYLLDNLYPRSLFREQMQIAVQKGLPEDFTIDFIRRSFPPYKINVNNMLYSQAVYKEMIDNIAQIYNKNKQALDDKENEDLNLKLFFQRNRIIKTHQFFNIDAAFVLKKAASLEWDMRKLLNFVNTSNHSETNQLRIKGTDETLLGYLVENFST